MHDLCWHKMQSILTAAVVTVLIAGQLCNSRYIPQTEYRPGPDICFETMHNSASFLVESAGGLGGAALVQRPRVLRDHCVMWRDS